MSPTARSLAHLREMGFTVAITEHWNPFAKIRQDLYGCFDLVALHESHKGVLGIQVTSRTNHSARRRKLLALPAVALWLYCGNRAWVMSWAKQGPRGKTKVWTCHIEAVTLADCERAA